MEFDAYLAAVGRRIRKARWMAGLTQEQVAAGGINYRYYQEIERGVRNPTVHTLVLLGEILGVPASLFLEVEPPEVLAAARARFARARPAAPKTGRKPRR